MGTRASSTSLVCCLIVLVSCAKGPPAAGPPPAADVTAPPAAALASDSPSDASQAEGAAAAAAIPAAWSAAGPKLEEAPGTRECPESLGGTERVDRVITKECGVVPVSKTYSVDGATLTLGPGAKLAFADGSALVVGRHKAAKLMVLGDEKQGVTFSAQGDQAAGVWKGVQLGRHGSRSYLGGLVVEHAGANEVALEIGAQEVTLLGSTFSSNKGVAVRVARGASLAAFDHNTFSDTALVPLRGPPAVVAAVGAGNHFADGTRIQVTEGLVEESMSWHPVSVPYELLGAVQVAGTGGVETTLEIAAGTRLKFDSDATIAVGRYRAAKLLVKGTAQAPVSFDASQESKAGAWKQIYVGRYGSAAFEYARFEHGGGVDAGGVLVAVGGAQLSVQHCAFVSNTAGLDLGSGTGATLLAFDANSFKQTPIALRVGPNHLGQLGPKNDYESGPRIIVHAGTVSANATWEVQRGARVELEGALAINGADVRVQPGYALSIDNVSIDVGRYKNASFSLVGTSAAPVTLSGVRDQPGAWGALSYQRRARGNVLSHVVVRNAGREQGAVLFVAESEGKVDTLSCMNCAGLALEVNPRANVEAKGVTPARPVTP